MSTTDVRVNEPVEETTFRFVKGGVDDTEGYVLSSRTETLRWEIHFCGMSKWMRVNWKASRTAVAQIFDCLDMAARVLKDRRGVLDSQVSTPVCLFCRVSALLSCILS